MENYKLSPSLKLKKNIRAMQLEYSAIMLNMSVTLMLTEYIPFEKAVVIYWE